MQKVLQIDIDAAEINKNILVSEEIIGDVKEVLGILNRNLKQQDHGAWLEKDPAI